MLEALWVRSSHNTDVCFRVVALSIRLTFCCGIRPVLHSIRHSQPLSATLGWSSFSGYSSVLSIEVVPFSRLLACASQPFVLFASHGIITCHIVTGKITPVLDPRKPLNPDGRRFQLTSPYVRK